VSLIQEIPVFSVDLDDHPFAASVTAETAPLVDSIETVGLLSPPWLRRKADGRWQVVAGRKRLRAAVSLGWETVTAHTLPAETPDSQCLLIALHDNALTRSFTPLEQAFYARKLLVFWEDAVVIKEFLPVLGLPPTVKYLERLLAAGSLEDSWQALLEQGRLALTAAARLAAWTPGDRQAALPFFQTLPFTQSKQEEFLEWLELLGRREGVAMSDILSRPELASCLEDPAHNPQEKAQQVRRQLKAWVFPRLSAAQAAFEQGLSRLGLKHHPRLRLAPPLAFEGPDFLLEIKFRDADELRRLLDELTRLARQEEFSILTSI
jgi:ParB family chromosome partitioning protein